MLDSSELLIDNLSLKRGGTELLAGGDFQGTAIGEVPDDWRFIGNHVGTVVVDPDDPNNRVLHLNALGAQQHVHDHMEVSFANGQEIQDGQTYTISFDAKWVSGSRQLNNRLYFTRAANTIVLDAPQNNGTPGAENSQFAENIGPTYTDFGHAPIIPDANKTVTVTVAADDPQGVDSMTLYYRTNTGSWISDPMTLANGAYSAMIPGQSAGEVVQFYVEGIDGLGAASTFPADGAESRALYEVNDGQGTTRPIETFRVVLRSGENSQLFSSVNTMSNNYVGGTLVVGNHTAFYDIGVRQIGSRFIRPNSGYKVNLHPDNRFLGVHKSVRFDIELLDEIIYKQMVNRAGGSETTMYDDLSYMISPQHSGRNILLNLARYESLFLEEQFGNTDGTKFELDDITIPRNPNADGFKTGTDAIAQDMEYHGPDPEAYRGQILIKNNRAKDAFDPIAEFVRVINLSGNALDESIDEVMDVDLWMRHYATQSFVGNWDTYGFRRPKNLRLFIRPSDGKIIPLYWDADRGNLTEPLIYNGGSSRLDDIRNIPRNERLFWGHMLDLVNRSFNGEYSAHWTSHFATLGAGTTGRQTQIVNRANQARTQAASAIPMVDFNITTNGGNPITVGETNVTLRGDGWIDVREVRLAGSEIPLNVEWTDNNSWQIVVPLVQGVNDITLEAFDFEGQPAGTANITVTTTAAQPAVRDQLRISELHFNPAGTDDTEFIELIHAGAENSSPISLAGVRFTDGVDFAFPEDVSLAAGERLVIVANEAAFEAAYGQGINIAGQYTGALRNGGEMIGLVDDVDTTIHSFEYNDNWFPETDGAGYSLTIADPTQDLALWGQKEGWRLSEDIGGSPGIPDNGLLPNAVVINEISSNDTAASGNWLEIHNRTDAPISLSNWYLSDEELDPMKYQFAADTSLVEGGFLVLDETVSFGNDGADGVTTSFTLSALGGVLWLNSADENGELLPYQVRRSYGAAEPDATQGLVKTSDGLKFATLTADTREGANQGPVIGPLVINEIHYNPAGEGVEFIEIANISNSAITLNEGGGLAWKFSNGIDYTFPVGEVLDAGGLAVVIGGTDGGDAEQTAADFRAANSVPADVAVYVYEPTANGGLANGGEELQLARPSTLVAGMIVVDEVDFEDSDPWPNGPDGNGPSLSKLEPEQFGNEPANWGTGSIDGTPGRTNVLVDTTAPSKPLNLVARASSDSEVAVAWSPSVDLESGISHYNVFRNGELYATTPVPFFLDSDVTFADEPVEYYVIAVNGDDLESSGRSNTGIVGTEVITFQQDTNGYTGASDATISEAMPDTNLGANDRLEFDSSDDNGGELAALVRWDDISIPDGRTILDAWFDFNVRDIGNPHQAFRVLQDWNEDEVTWNNAQNGSSWQVAGASGAEDIGMEVGAMVGRDFGAFIWVLGGINAMPFNEDGLAMVTEWLDDPSTNHGILIGHSSGNTSNNLMMDSKEAPEIENRPALKISLAPVVTELVPGDFTLDDEVTADDLTVMCGAIRSGADHAVYDLDNSGGPANLSDLDVLLAGLGTTSGDANLDGRVNAADLNVIGQNWLETGDHLGWGSGDFTCDGEVGPGDLNQVGRNWQFGVARAPRAALAANVQMTPERQSINVDFAGDYDEVVGMNEPLEVDSNNDHVINRPRWQAKATRADRVSSSNSSEAVESDSLEQIADEIFRRFDF